MKRISLINPNTSQATTAMMTDIARRYLPPGFSLDGLTAVRSVPMILNAKELHDAAAEVFEMGMSAIEAGAEGIIVSAFGDPGLERILEKTAVPAVGICQASMLEASAGGRRFGIATVTPDLVESFAAKADSLGVSHLFTGTRLTTGEPMALAADPGRLLAGLEDATRRCFEEDGAEAVIIGGGPLGQAAEDIQQRLSAPVIAPIRSAVKLLLTLMSRPAHSGAA